MQGSLKIKNQKTKYNLNGNILRMTFFKITKAQKYLKTPQNQSLKNSKSLLRRIQMKNPENSYS